MARKLNSNYYFVIITIEEFKVAEHRQRERICLQVGHRVISKLDKLAWLELAGLVFRFQNLDSHVLFWVCWRLLRLRQLCVQDLKIFNPVRVSNCRFRHFFLVGFFFEKKLFIFFEHWLDSSQLSNFCFFFRCEAELVSHEGVYSSFNHVVDYTNVPFRQGRHQRSVLEFTVAAL